MIREYYNNIVNGLDVKQNLLSVKELLKDTDKGSRSKEALLLMIGSDYSVFKNLLHNDDPKIRKNTAIVLGVLGAKDCADDIFEAYKSDDVMYNKASYVEALKKIGHVPYSDYLKNRFEELKKGPVSEENKKHILDEMKQLKSIFGTGRPEFIGYDLVNTVILTTNRNYKYITASLLKDVESKEFPAGLIVKTDRLRSLLPVRTYEELLFIPEKVKTVSNDPVKAAKELVDKGIRDYIFSRIGIIGDRSGENDSLRINFRTELRSKDRAKNTDFARKFSGELETLTKWELSNSVSAYDVEFRFIENSKGDLNVLLKFCILKDVRFSYRKQNISAGIKPYLAATLMQLAKPYLSSNSVVLDPFCGVGTMLAEHEPVANARLYYGIDIFKEAVEKANVNLKAAGILRKTELITKDFFDFSHEHKFNEIITDMPFVTEKKTLDDIKKLYREFFVKCGTFLEKNGVIVVYSRNPEFVKEFYKHSGCSLKEDFEISKYENSHLFILSL